MKKRTKRTWLLFALFCLTSYFLFASLSFTQEMPKPGEVVDKSNYKKYSHLFPEEFWPAFENGFGGFWKPISMKVVETKPALQPKKYLAYSEKNRGKFTLDKDGYIVGGYDHEGLPFPGVTKDDKDFATKFMWNTEYRYQADDWKGPEINYSKRKGETPFLVSFPSERLSFINRIYSPKIENPTGIERAQINTYVEPNSMKDFKFLTFRYLDPKKPDDTYLYIPSMRRVLRGDAGQRSTPLQGTIVAMDDFTGFEGKVSEFTYQFVREQKVLGIVDTGLTIEKAKALRAQSGKEMPFLSDNFEVRDVYVINIKSKDSQYPQSKKQIYIDKECHSILYTIVWDRAGKLWKVWCCGFIGEPLADGNKVHNFSSFAGLDIQSGYANFTCVDFKVNGQGFTSSDFVPSVLVKKSR